MQEAPAESSRARTEQRLLDTYFDSRASYWKKLYQQDGVHQTIIQVRRDVVLAFVDKLALSPPAHVLEVGCGAGVTAVAVAQRGHVVVAVDTVDTMVSLTRQLATEKGVEQLVTGRVCDVHSLPFPDHAFDLVLAIGVMPWVASPDQPLGEMVRVLRPGGHIIVTAQNRTYFTRTAIQLAGRVLRRLGLLKPRTMPPLHYRSIREFDALLSKAGVEKFEARTVGFEIVSYVPKAVRPAVHGWLDNLTLRMVPWVRYRGTNYVVLAKKSG